MTSADTNIGATTTPSSPCLACKQNSAIQREAMRLVTLYPRPFRFTLCADCPNLAETSTSIEEVSL